MKFSSQNSSDSTDSQPQFWPAVSSRWFRSAAVGGVAVLALVASPAASSGHEHTVQPGESLGSIAPQYGVSVGDLVSANGLTNPDIVWTGTVLSVPHGATSSTNSASSYTVAYGDSLGSIAARFNTTVANIAAANGIGDPNLVQVGAVLQVSGAGSTNSVSQASASSYVVRPGDTLAAIASKYGTTVSAIAQANGLSNPNLVVAGSSLDVETQAAPTQTQTVVGTEVAPLLNHWAATYGVPVDLLKALTWYESGWNNTKISEVGAIGVGQLMPDTVDFLEDVLVGESLDPHNVSDNVRGSARFLRYLLDENGWDTEMAVASYYQGLAATRQYGVYTSSRNYVDGILSLRSRF